MSQRLYKDTLNFLKKTSLTQPEGNHLKRLTKLSAMICSCMTTKKSSLESLSNSYDAKDVQKESHIKQSKRFLTSKWVDWLSFFAPFITSIIEQLALTGELILIIDGTQTAGNCNTLMLSVLWKKYAIPLVWLTKVGEKSDRRSGAFWRASSFRFGQSNSAYYSQKMPSSYFRRW